MIRLENVTKVYDGGVVALKDIDIDINKGEFVFLVGPSGSGKSTLIRLMMREEAPTNGDIWIAGKHASTLPAWKVPHLRRSIGTVFQDFKLLPNKTVYENVAFAMEVTGKPRSAIDAQVPQVLKLVGLSEMADRIPRHLSGGEQQRVSMARAFVNRPLILLADEPTGNLDPATSVGIMRIFDRINRTGTTVVMATHDHAIVDAMQRRVIQLERGRMLRDESRGVYETAAQGPVELPEEPATDSDPVDAAVQTDAESSVGTTGGDPSATVDTVDVTTTDSSADADEAQADPADPADLADGIAAAHGGDSPEEESEPSVEAILSAAASTDDDGEIEG